jgi:hypothetical protein
MAVPDILSQDVTDKIKRERRYVGRITASEPILPLT